ncbi:MAG: anaerobic ribonucleoside triphosphate reductase, partial [Hornefia butyriciproducens]|nr:anaerobic ribonucleoside triphosphate reductase [Hornefia butyriciproducens]
VELKQLLQYADEPAVRQLQEKAAMFADREIVRKTYQAMEALIHNLNTMHSRAGAQVPFSSINYGTDTSPEGRLVMNSVMEATEAGLGNGETPIFPIQIFKVKEGVSYNPEDPNYDLFKLACRTSARRLFPNFSFLDAPFNKQFYKEGHPETECAYMGCRTRVIGNVYDPSREIVYGRGNLSFTSINLPRLAIKAKGDQEIFFENLDHMIDLCIGQLMERFRIQGQKKVKNFPFLMGQGVWIDSDKLGPEDTVEEVIRHGTLTIGFIGLAECLKALIGQHHGESPEAEQLGIEIVAYMRKRMDEEARKTGLNWSLIATPAEGLSGRFVRIDRERFGVIPGVTDREYYTNSFHIPVYYEISAFDKIRKEAPFHELTNGGHISYIELDGDPLKNLEAYESVVRCMKESGIGYGSINHPVDRDPVCGYTGIIDNECPSCGRREGDGNPNFERIRRITGYLVGTMDNWNDAKTAEERDRVKHGLSSGFERL